MSNHPGCPCNECRITRDRDALKLRLAESRAEIERLRLALTEIADWCLANEWAHGLSLARAALGTPEPRPEGRPSSPPERPIPAADAPRVPTGGDSFDSECAHGVTSCDACTDASSTRTREAEQLRAASTLLGFAARLVLLPARDDARCPDCLPRDSVVSIALAMRQESDAIMVKQGKREAKRARLPPPSDPSAKEGEPREVNFQGVPGSTPGPVAGAGDGGSVSHSAEASVSQHFDPTPELKGGE